MFDNSEYKKCSKCKEVKLRSEFTICSKNKDGLSFSCKSCAKLHSDSRRERLREIDKQFRIREKEGKVLHRTPRNPDEIRKAEIERIRTYKLSHPEKVKEQNRQYLQTERGRKVSRLRTARYKTRKASAFIDFSEKEFQFLLWFQSEKCGCCHKKFTDELKPEIDHIVPVSFGGDLTLDNTQLLCRSCNARKKDKTIRYISEISSSHIEEWRLTCQDL